MTTIYIVYTPKEEEPFIKVDTKPTGIVLPKRIIKVENYTETDIDNAKFTFDSESNTTTTALPVTPPTITTTITTPSSDGLNLGGGARIKKNQLLGKKTRKVRAPIRLE